jgi:hypothetical protein
MRSQNPFMDREGAPESPAVPQAQTGAEPAAAERAMESDHHAFAGSAEGVGSVAFDDRGAFGADARPEEAEKDPPER